MKGIFPNSVVALNSLMQSFCKNDKMGYAESVLEEMIPIGLPINQGLFALIINWLCEAGQKET